jgi:hypothetical protein
MRYTSSIPIERFIDSAVTHISLSSVFTKANGFPDLYPLTQVKSKNLDSPGVLNLTMKKGILIFIVFFLVGFLVLYILPIEVTHSRELKRGNILIENIENYVNETGKIPESHNWETLRSLGFMEDEMETAYPEIRQINDSTYELIFTIGFDPPYLMWNSQERIWKDDFPTIPDEWKNKN